MTENPTQQRQATNYCPFCGEETLFPREEGGWECRSCARAFSVTFHGLVTGRFAGGTGRQVTT